MSVFTVPNGYVAQTPLVEGRHTGGFMVSQANAHRSIDQMVLIAGQNLPVGTIVGQIAASGLVTALAPAATDGSEIAVGILFDSIDATTTNANCAVVVRDAEVNLGELAFGTLTGAQQAAALAQLAVAHVIARA